VWLFCPLPSDANFLFDFFIKGAPAVQGIFKTGSDSAQRKAWLQKKKRLAGGLLPNEGILAEDFGDSSASSGEGDSDEELEEENGTKESGGDSDESSLNSDASDVEVTVRQSDTILLGLSVQQTFCSMPLLQLVHCPGR
jgi:hypothetical protein